MTHVYEVTVAAGSLRRAGPGVTAFAHRWTAAGVSVEAAFTGAHMFHLAVAGCVLNDLYREAEALDLSLDGVLVRARGDFDTESWASTGISYVVDLDTDAGAEQQQRLLSRVDDVAEIPRAIRLGATVTRVER